MDPDREFFELYWIPELRLLNSKVANDLRDNKPLTPVIIENISIQK